MFHYQMLAASAVFAFLLLYYLAHHYWFLFVVFLTMPSLALWLAGDVVRPMFSHAIHKIARDVLVGTTIVLAVVGLVNLNYMRGDLGKRFVDGYKIVTSHDCDAPEGESMMVPTSSAPPDTCRAEDLSGVSTSGRLLLRITEYVYFLVAFIIVALTVMIGNSTVSKRSQEEWNEKHQDLQNG